MSDDSFIKKFNLYSSWDGENAFFDIFIVYDARNDYMEYRINYDRCSIRDLMEENITYFRNLFHERLSIHCNMYRSPSLFIYKKKKK